MPILEHTKALMAHEREVREQQSNCEREIRESKLEHEREIRVAHMERDRMAMSLQAAEYGRRLDELNHAHAMAAKEREQYLSGSVFFTWRDEFDKWKIAQIEIQATERGRMVENRRVFAVVLTISMMFVNALMIYLTKHF